MLSWFFNKSLKSYLNETKTIRISKIKFKIKKINTLNYIEGAKVLKQVYDTYKTKGNVNDMAQMMNDKKVIDHFSHVIVAGVLEPKLSYTKDGEGIFIEDLFCDWGLVSNLYNEIMEFTYGKKKMKL
jgi:hypothetical protein